MTLKPLVGLGSIALLALTACGGVDDATPQAAAPTVTVTAEPEPAPTVTVTQTVTVEPESD
ncbi:MAG TPA: hypothetical protein VK065_06165, partial [Brevibacterium sp.]|nr:hypothetical protein [Brevibacterium sp.]